MVFLPFPTNGNGEKEIGVHQSVGVHLVYKWYFSCQLGDNMLPTTFYKNLKNLLNLGYGPLTVTVTTRIITFLGSGIPT